MTDIDDYLKTADPARAQRLLTIIEKIQSLYPEARLSMDSKMPTFKTDNGWVAIANQKNYISFYTCSAEHIAEFKQQFPGIKTGKGCINFKDTDPIDFPALEKVIHSALDKEHRG